MAEDTQTEELLVPVEESESVDIKHIFESKTFWVNAIAIVAFLIQRKFGFVIDEAVQAQILAAVNVALRSITHKPVRWTKKKV